MRTRLESYRVVDLGKIKQLKYDTYYPGWGQFWLKTPIFRKERLFERDFEVLKILLNICSSP